jgi:hypothetical protein
MLSKNNNRAFKIIIPVILMLFSFKSPSENPYTGTWKSYEIKSFHGEVHKFPDFYSEIIFNADMTFTKTTRGNKTTGKYQFTSNTFKFLVADSSGKYKSDWFLRVPKGDKIPMRYPELFTIKDENGKDQLAELDVYYKKTE